VIFTTLDSGASYTLKGLCEDKIDYLIIDEACQATESSCLIPLSLKPKIVIMVGDHRQLPPITFSKNAIETNFSRPFFERLFLLFLKNSMVNVHYHMLDV